LTLAETVLKEQGFVIMAMSSPDLFPEGTKYADRECTTPAIIVREATREEWAEQQMRFNPDEDTSDPKWKYFYRLEPKP
jgi:hypothetical protein